MLFKRIGRAKFALVLTAAIAFAFAACGGNTGGDVRLQGAGATFPNPLYQKWLSEYGKLHSNVKIDYQSIGSGAGIMVAPGNAAEFAAAVLRVLTDLELRQNLTRLAREELRNFSIDAMAERVLSVYRSCAHSHDGS